MDNIFEKSFVFVYFFEVKILTNKSIHIYVISKHFAIIKKKKKKHNLKSLIKGIPGLFGSTFDMIMFWFFWLWCNINVKVFSNVLYVELFVNICFLAKSNLQKH